MRRVGAVTLALAVTTLGGVSHAQTPARPPVPGAPAGVTAFVDVAVIPMDTERTLRHQTVLIREGRIAALGPAATLPVPPGAVRIDGRGRYLLPGFGACHGHISVRRVPSIPYRWACFPGWIPAIPSSCCFSISWPGVLPCCASRIT